MAKIKMTKKDYFANLRTIVEGTAPANMDALLAFIDHEVDLLNKKSSSTKPTKTQEANAVIMENILNALTVIGKPVTISEMQAVTPELSATEFTIPKISALLTNLRKAGKVVKMSVKKKTLFTTAELYEVNGLPDGATLIPVKQ